MFLCLREGYISSFPFYQDLEKVLQTLKIPGKVLEFCFDQRGRTLSELSSSSFSSLSVPYSFSSSPISSSTSRHLHHRALSSVSKSAARVSSDSESDVEDAGSYWENERFAPYEEPLSE